MEVDGQWQSQICHAIGLMAISGTSVVIPDCFPPLLELCKGSTVDLHLVRAIVGPPSPQDATLPAQSSWWLQEEPSSLSFPAFSVRLPHPTNIHFRPLIPGVSSSSTEKIMN